MCCVVLCYLFTQCGDQPLQIMLLMNHHLLLLILLIQLHLQLSKLHTRAFETGVYSDLWSCNSFCVSHSSL